MRFKLLRIASMESLFRLKEKRGLFLIAILIIGLWLFSYFREIRIGFDAAGLVQQCWNQRTSVEVAKVFPSDRVPPNPICDLTKSISASALAIERGKIAWLRCSYIPSGRIGQAPTPWNLSVGESSLTVRLDNYGYIRSVSISFPLLLALGGVLATWYIALLVVEIARASRRLQNRCVKCGYDLCGLPEPRCPECGTGFQEVRAAQSDGTSSTKTLISGGGVALFAA